MQNSKTSMCIMVVLFLVNNIGIYIVIGIHIGIGIRIGIGIGICTLPYQIFFGPLG